MPATTIWNNRVHAVALGLGLGLSAIIGPCWWSVVRDHHPTCSENKTDFISFYTAAKLMWTDRSALYDLEQQRLVQQLIDPSRGRWVLPYFYPPFFAVVLVPLAWLPFSLAFIAMTLVNCALLIASIRILIQKLQLNRQQSSWLIVATFCNYGVHYALLEAQTSFITLILLVLYVTTLNSPAENRAGIWSGLMFFKPQLALAPVIVLIGRRKWVAIGLVIGIVGFLGLVSLFAIGLAGLEHYITVIPGAVSGEDGLHVMPPERPERMHNLRALAYFFLPAPWRDYVWWSATLGVVAFIVIRARANEDQGISIRQWTSILVAMILVTPHFHDHDLTLLTVPLALFLKWAGDGVVPPVALALVALGMLSLINTVAYPHFPPLVPLVLLIFLIVEQRRGSQIIA
jgi:glycosyl transferase family 87